MGCGCCEAMDILRHLLVGRLKVSWPRVSQIRVDLSERLPLYVRMFAIEISCCNCC